MSVNIEKWDYFELALKGPETGNPFLEVKFERISLRTVAEFVWPAFMTAAAYISCALCPIKRASGGM
jgi:hypothetical protein